MQKLTNLQTAETVENPPGINRTTLAFGDEAMLCHFQAKAGSTIPLHHHVAVQVGYVVKGKARFQRGGNGDSFVAEAGSSYFFASDEPHGAEILEDAEFVEVFSPSRPEYETGAS